MIRATLNRSNIRRSDYLAKPKRLSDNSRPSGHYLEKRVETSSTTKGASKRRLVKFLINTVSYSNGVIKRWVVLSTGKRPVLVRYLLLKLIYDELSKKEFQLLLSLDESTNNLQIYFALRANKLKINKRIIRKMLEKIPFNNLKLVTRDEYISSKQIEFTIKDEQAPLIKKPKPYTGYSRGYKDGKSSSKGPKVDEFGSSPLVPSPKFEDEINILIQFAREVSQNPRIIII